MPTLRQEPLLVAFALSLSHLTRENEVAFMTEGHGREGVLGVECDRSVGWYTSLFPVHLHLAKGDQRESTYQNIIQQWRAIPDNGLSYGALRYLNDETKQAISEPDAPIVFNFLGTFNNNNDQGWRTFDENSGQDASQFSLGHSVFELNCAIIDKQFIFQLSFCPQHFSSLEVESFKADFLKLVPTMLQASQNVETSTHADKNTASQIQPFDPLHNSDITESTFGLTPTQEGMLFHTRLEPTLDSYFVQTLWDYDIVADRQRMEQAWSLASRQFEVFRTLYIWKEGQRPQQCIVDYSCYQFAWSDLSQMTKAEQQRHIDDLIQQDRHQPFDLNKPGPIRAHWLILSPHHARLLLSHHHILLDGWSLALLLKAIDQLYENQLEEKAEQRSSLPLPSPSFRHFVTHAEQVDISEARDFFRQELSKGQCRSRLPVGGVATELDELKLVHQLQHLEHSFNEQETAEFIQATRQAGVTLGALLLFSAGTLLSAYDDGTDIVFGTILSGRNHAPELTNTLGMMASTLPVIFRPNWSIGLKEALQRMHQSLGELNRHSLIPMREIIDEHTGGPLRFSSIVTFENYPGQEKHDIRDGNLIKEIENTAYPLTIVFRPHQQQLELKISYDAEVFSQSDIHVLREDISLIVLAIARDNLQRCGQLSALVSGNSRRLFNETAQLTTGQQRPQLGSQEAKKLPAKRLEGSIGFILGSRR